MRVTNMDIVQQNQDLEFPDNVEYDFVYWQHIAQNHEKMLDAVEDCDVVAFECARILSNRGKWSTRRHMRKLLRGWNNILSDGLPEDKKNSPLRLALAEENSHYALTHHYAGSGKKLYLVDAWEHSGDTRHISQMSREDRKESRRKALTDTREYRLSCEIDARYMAARESIVLRQLADIGRKVAPADERETVKVAVVFGSAHSFISVAAHALGAQVKRNFLVTPSEKTYHPHDMLSRTMRLYGAESERVEKVYRAQMIAQYALMEHESATDEQVFTPTHRLGDDYRCTLLLLARDIEKTLYDTSNESANIIRAYVEDCYGYHPLEFSDDERSVFTQMYRRSIRNYVAKADKLADRNIRDASHI